MAKDVDLTSKEWTDIVFEGKNKEFGAYVLRSESPNRHTKALVIVIVAIAIILALVVATIQGLFTPEKVIDDAANQAQSVNLGEMEEEEEEPEVAADLDIPEPEPEPEPQQAEDDVAATQALTELNIVENVNKENEIKDKEDVREDLSKIGTATHEGSDDLNKAAVVAEVVQEAPKKEEVKVVKPKDEGPVSMAVVEQKPQFPGGDAAMYSWIGSNMNYPAQAAEEGVSGKVTVQFIVEKDGSISNVKVVRGKHPALDAEAVRVVKKMPKWVPGRNNGAPVRVTYLLPVTFRLQQ